MISRLVSVAPMMGWTDRHARYFLRLITKHTLLYTEMVNTGALLHNNQKVGNQKRFLAFHPSEQPLALQLGGSDPLDLAQCALMAEDAGFDEVNLNVGCPSDRVKSGHFGACLMAHPELVADCVSAMKTKVSVPVTVKCRIGIDDMEGYQPLEHFINIVAEGGCDTFIVHARKAWLKGLSPKQNREIPPLKYDYVYRLKRERPELTIVINGGIKTIEAAQQQLEHVDGVMIGREAYYNPYILACVDQDIYHDANATPKSREEIVDQMCNYIDSEIAKGTGLHSITRHILGLYHGCPGAKAWRRYLSENAHRPDADSSVVKTAVTKIMS
ncbi:MAG: tRNA dihydrouridine(20/20a) synthase DusA [Gammaproteobacteria bacterium]|jgi:tRNA-dihydrouridine synthase A|nr:tRNA dihydrouridine(20/20a) synthase DusA [Gammaproteobacteria bacterium]